MVKLCSKSCSVFKNLRLSRKNLAKNILYKTFQQTLSFISSLVTKVGLGEKNKDLLKKLPLQYLLKNLHPSNNSNNYNNLALELLSRIRFLLHSDWSEIRLT